MMLPDFGPWNQFVKMYSIKNLYITVDERDRISLMSHESSMPKLIRTFCSVDDAISYVRDLIHQDME